MVLQYIFRKKVLSAEHFKKHLWLKMLVQYYKTIAELEKKVSYYLYSLQLQYLLMSFKIWNQIIDKDRIFLCSKSDNFWEKSCENQKVVCS